MHPPKWNDSLLQNIQIHHYASLSKNSMSFGEKNNNKTTRLYLSVSHLSHPPQEEAGGNVMM